MTVPGHGPLNAKIALVGEAPGEQEEREGLPFVGASGRLLNQMLASAGIARGETYVTNVVKQRPANNDFGIFYEDKQRKRPSQLLLKSYEDLSQELQRGNFNIIVCLGAEAFRALYPLRASITDARGTIFKASTGHKAIGTYHPAFVLRVYNSRPIVELDLRRAFEQSKTRSIEYPPTNFSIDPTFTDVIEFLRSIQNGHTIAFDIESVGPITRCIGIATSAERAMCIPLTSNTYRIKTGTTTLLHPEAHNLSVSSHWSEGEETSILFELKRVLETPGIRKIAQNFPFDSTFIGNELGINCFGLYLDTMIGHHVLYPEFPKNLDFINSVYNEFPYYSGFDNSIDEELWKYNCYDCVATFAASSKIERELHERSLWQYYKLHRERTMLALTRMQNRGVLISEEARLKEKDKYLGEMDRCLKLVHEIAGFELNPKSPKQVGELLYQKLGMRAQYNKDDGLTTGEHALEKLMKDKKNEGHVPLLKAILDYRSMSTIYSTFVECKTTPEGRMKTSYNVAGTVTGRLSSSSTFDGYGGNLQNIPIREGATIRRMYVPDKGKVWIKADLSQAEFRLVVWYARIQRLIDRYTNDLNFDVHRLNACLAYHVTDRQADEFVRGTWEPLGELLAQVTKDQRALAKNGAYGSQYGMQPPKAALTYKMPFEQAKFVMDRYHRLYPEISGVFWRETQGMLNATRKLKGPMSSERMFFGRLDDDLYREGYSWRCQHVVGDIVSRGICILDEILPSGADLLLQVHDEIDIQCYPKQVPLVAELIKNTLEYPVKIPGVEQPCIIPVEVNVGTNWYDVVDLDKWIKESNQ